MCRVLDLVGEEESPLAVDLRFLLDREDLDALLPNPRDVETHLTSD